MSNSKKTQAYVVSVNISKVKGTVKHTVPFGELIENYGLKDDAHAGAWHRQLSLLASESYDKMQKAGVTDLEWGVFAENITTKGIELYTLPVGTLLRIGESTVEITQIGKECHKGCEIYRKVGMCVMPTEGIFARVIKSGTVKPGDEIEIIPT